MTKISLCMIARDEERFLADCLASVRDAADELVVVDTGSTDRTRSIASAAGATVVEFPWIDDFAAARNAGLARASGTHVLVLDADERLAQGAARALRRAAQDTSVAVGMLPLHDADALDAPEAEVVAGRRRLSEPAWLPRFFRRGPERVFRRRVHETILRPGEDSSMARIVAVDAPIVHLGEVKELRAARGKDVRNTRLLDRALAEDPTDGELAGYLAMELARAGDLTRAESVARASFAPFLERIDALPEGALRPSPVQLAYVLATCALARGDAREALATIDAATRRCREPHPNLLFLAATARERLGEIALAERDYHACLAQDGRRFTIPVNPGFTSSAPRLRLASAALARGDVSAALARLDGITGVLDLPARLLRAEALLVRRDAASALRELAPLLARNDPAPDLFALAAWASALSGARDPVFVEAARRAPAERWLEPRRMSLLRTE